MLKFARAAITFGIMLFFAVVMVGGFVLIVSGGDPVDYLRTTWLRIQLAGREDDLLRPAGTDTKERIFEVALGSTPVIIARDLQQVGLIRDDRLFVNYVRVEGLDTQLEAGTYFLQQTMTIPEIARLLTDSRNASITFRVAEGWRAEEIAAAIDSNPRFGFRGTDFLTLVRDAPVNPALAEELGITDNATLEGFLFPDTYVLSPGVTAAGLVDTLVTRFLDVTGAELRDAARTQGFTVRDAVILASIIERESVWDDENARIASVYRNRLAIDMKLDADPTVQYGLNGTRGDWWPQITLADYQGVISPYNTYRAVGLPPGPIANPSLSAIQAAIYPEDTPYYYFRAKCDGSHYHNFAETYQEHLANGC